MRAGTNRIYFALATVFIVALLAACGGGGGSSNGGGGGGKKFPTSPETLKQGDPYPILANSELTVGNNRVAVGVIGPDSKPLVDALAAWLPDQYAKVSPNGKVGKAIAYSLNAWDALVRFLDDGRLCMTNNAAERALRCIAVGRNNWTFAGSDSGGDRAAAIYTLIETAKLNDVDPLAWLADALARLQDHPAKRLDELLPWNWKLQHQQRAAA